VLALARMDDRQEIARRTRAHRVVAPAEDAPRFLGARDRVGVDQDLEAPDRGQALRARELDAPRGELVLRARHVQHALHAVEEHVLAERLHDEVGRVDLSGARDLVSIAQHHDRRHGLLSLVRAAPARHRGAPLERARDARVDQRDVRRAMLERVEERRARGGGIGAEAGLLERLAHEAARRVVGRGDEDVRSGARVGGGHESR